MSAADRKAELERKKAKLAALREEKKRKEEERRRKELEEVADKEAASKNTDLRSETEKMLKDLGISPTSADKPSPPSTKTSTPSQSSQDSGDNLPTTQLHQVPVSHLGKTKLTVSKVSQTNIPPKDLVLYNKETQTPQEQAEREDDDADSLEVSAHTPPVLPKMPHVEHVKPAFSPDDEVPPPPVEPKVEKRELTEEEKQKIMLTEGFYHFIDRSTRLVERALAEEVDIYVDYAGGDEKEGEGGLQEGEKLKLSRQFFDERWSKHRTVTCIDWSVQHPELLVASYNHNDESPHEPDGVALIWNIKYKKDTPEYIFHCQSAVMSTCFAKFHPNLVVGGTYSGQIVLWDNRSHKRTPVQRTPLSAAAHTHPVYCVNVVGTQNAHNLISVSTDGKICSWSLDMLSSPQDSMELQHKQSKAVAVTSFSFLSGDVNNFVVGSEEGAVYTACRHGSKAGISDMFEGHQGPVTGIDCHSVPGHIDFSHYFLSSSIDWTVKLWNMKENKPMHSFEDNSDYVYDVRWSPVHPALFASVDGNGRLDLWNLNTDIEVPTASTYVEGNVALNRCRWHQGGHQIAVGDDLGKIHIYDVGEHIATAHHDEWSKFVHTLQDMKSDAAEQDEESSNLSSLSSPLR